jgi:hypothetical protein
MGLPDAWYYHHRRVLIVDETHAKIGKAARGCFQPRQRPQAARVADRIASRCRLDDQRHHDGQGRSVKATRLPFLLPIRQSITQSLAFIVTSRSSSSASATARATSATREWRIRDLDSKSSQERRVTFFKATPSHERHFSKLHKLQQLQQHPGPAQSPL